MKKLVSFLLLSVCCSAQANIPAWASWQVTGNSEHNLAGQPSWNAEGSPKGRLQDVGDQTTYATLGGGTVTKKDGTAHNTENVNRDLNNTQEITLDQQIAGLNANLTVDHRLATQDGRNAIKKDAVDTYEHGQDIGRTTSAIYQNKELGLLNIAETLDKFAKGTQVKNDLLHNPDNAHILEGLNSSDPETYSKAVADLGHLAQNKFGLDLSDISLYDASITTSLSLADTRLSDVKGGTVVEQGHQEYGNIFIDAGDGASKTDITNTLGHEIVENQYLQGKGDGLTGGLFGANSYETKEALANVFGNQLADRINQASNGNLDSSGGKNFANDLKNSQAVNIGTNRADNVGNAQVEHRQLYLQEAQAILKAAPAYAKKHNIDEEQAKKELTQQALRQVDKNWSEQIPENDRARDALNELTASLGKVSEDSIGRNWLDIWFDTETSIPFTAKDQATYEDTYLNSREAGLAERFLKNKDREGFYTAYATENATKPLDISFNEALAYASDETLDIALALYKQITNEPIDFATDVGKALFNSALEAIYSPMQTFVYSDSKGSAGDRQLIAELQNNLSDAQKESFAAIFGAIDDALSPVVPAKAVGKQLVKDSAAKASSGKDNLTKTTPKDFASSQQGTIDYPNRDSFQNTTLKPGDRVHQLEPSGDSAFYFDDKTLEKYGHSSKKMADALQVKPYKKHPPRSRYTTYEVNKETPAAKGVVKANCQYGAGGGCQVVVPNRSNLEPIDKGIFGGEK